MKLIPKNKSANTVVTTATNTEHTFENSPVIVVETKVDDNPSVFKLKRTGPHNSYACVVEYSDFSKMRFDKIWESAKFDFKSIEEIDFDNIYHLYTDGGVLFDVNGEVVPCLHEFNYIGTPFHNECLNLKKAIKVLKNHPWVMNKDDLEIQEIPYYNSDKNKNKFIEVHICPDKETYNKLYQGVILDTFKTDGNGYEKYWSCRLEERLHDGHLPDKDYNLLGLLECVKKDSQ